MASQNNLYSSGYINFDYTGNTAATNSIYIPQFVGYAPGMTDPLSRNIPPAPHVEAEKEWLRRRVNETLWRAA